MDGFTGGCQCGAVRYTLRRARLTSYCCHCRECQKQTSAAYSLSVPVMAADFEPAGETSVFARPSDSGAVTSCHFCPRCGTRLYHQSSRSPEFVTVKGGTLDDATILLPAAHLWVSRKQPWVILPEGVQRFDTQPANLKSWRESLMA